MIKLTKPNNKRSWTLYGLGLVSLALLSFFLYFYISAPSIIKNKTTEALNEMNFQDVTINKVARSGNIVKLSDIELDQDGFNTIDEIRIHYNFFPLLFFGNIDKASIKEIDLTQSTSQEMLLRTPKDFIREIKIPFKKLFKINTVELSDSKINIFVDGIGGLGFDFEGIIRGNDNNSRNVDISFESKQRQLSSNIKFTGEITKDAGWSIETLVDRTRLESENLQISRASGRVLFSSAQDEFFSNAEFNIGGFKIGQFAWSDIAASYEQNNHQYSWILAGQALGNPELEFGLNYSTQNPASIQGSIYARKIADILNYWDASKGIEQSSATPLRDLEDIFINYSLPINNVFTQEKSVIFNLKKPTQNIDIKGNIFFQDDAYSIRGLMSPTLVNDIHLNDNIVLKRASVEMSVGLDQNNSEDQDLTLKVTDGFLDIGPITLTNLNTDIDFSMPEQLQMSEFATTTFRLPLLDTIEQSGSAEFKIEPALSIRNLQLEIFDGTLTIKPMSFDTSMPYSLKVSAQDINLEKISNHMGDNIHLKGNASLSGNLLIHPNHVKAKNLVISSEKPGTIKINEDFSKFIFPDESLEHQTTIDALKDFRFRNIELTLNGNLSEKTSIQLSLEGRNPDILNGQPINFQIELEEQDLKPIFNSFINPSLQTEIIFND